MLYDNEIEQAMTQYMNNQTGWIKYNTNFSEISNGEIDNKTLQKCNGNSHTNIEYAVYFNQQKNTVCVAKPVQTAAPTNSSYLPSFCYKNLKQLINNTFGTEIKITGIFLGQGTTERHFVPFLSTQETVTLFDSKDSDLKTFVSSSDRPSLFKKLKQAIGSPFRRIRTYISHLLGVSRKLTITKENTEYTQYRLATQNVTDGQSCGYIATANLKALVEAHCNFDIDTFVKNTASCQKAYAKWDEDLAASKEKIQSTDSSPAESDTNALIIEKDCTTINKDNNQPLITDTATHNNDLPTQRVIALDYDGCLQHYSKDNETIDSCYTAEHLYQSNLLLWEFLELSKNIDSQIIQDSPNTPVIMNGSNRQTVCHEYVNAYQAHYADITNYRPKSPWWASFQALANQLKVQSDPFVLQDAWLSYENKKNDVQANTLIQHASCSEEQLKEHFDTARKNENVMNLDSKYKYLQLYTQLHRCAMLYPDHKVEFTFVDDREDILKHLHRFYKRYSELIPKNVTLKLVLYTPYKNDKAPRAFNTPIVGVGTVNNTYFHIVGELAQQEIKSHERQKWENALLHYTKEYEMNCSEEQLKEHFDTARKNENVMNLDSKYKYLQLYTQLHRCAMLYPDHKVEFTFVDDREDILKHLHRFYKRYSELIPKNVTLKLVLYTPYKNDKAPRAFNTPIVGVGTVNNTYFHIVGELAQQEIKSHERQKWENALLHYTKEYEMNYRMNFELSYHGLLDKPLSKLTIQNINIAITYRDFFLYAKKITNDLSYRINNTTLPSHEKQAYKILRDLLRQEVIYIGGRSRTLKENFEQEPYLKMLCNKAKNEKNQPDNKKFRHRIAFEEEFITRPTDPTKIINIEEKYQASCQLSQYIEKNPELISNTFTCVIQTMQNQESSVFLKRLKQSILPNNILKQNKSQTSCFANFFKTNVETTPHTQKRTHRSAMLSY